MSDLIPGVCVMVVCMIFVSREISCQTVTNAKALRTQLFTTNSYDVTVRPTTNHSLATGVSIVLSLRAINSLNAVSESLVTTVGMTVSWTDDQLVWTPATYGGITSYHYPESNIWKPPISLKNSYAAYQKFGDSSLNVRVFYDGTVEWNALEVFESTCAMDIYKYPFDVQTCQLTFMAYGFTRSEVEIVSNGSGYDFDDYKASPAWDLIDHSWSISGDPDSISISFSITLRRKPMFVLMTTILPIVLLSILNLFVFVIPCEEGEKAGYAVTVFLAISIFLTIVATILPDHSDSASLLSIYLTLLTVLSTVITSIALMMLRCSSFSEDTQIPKVLIFAIELTRCKWCRSRDSLNHSITHKEKDPETQGQQADIHSPDKSKPETPVAWAAAYTWKEAMNALDAVLFVVFLIILSLSTIICFCVASST